MTEAYKFSLANQVAGHEGIFKSGGIVVKPCTQQEIDFYEYSRASKHAIVEHIPKFMGVLQANQIPTATLTDIDTIPPPKHKSAIVLEDIEHGFRRPCVIDIKLGRVLASPDATDEKKRRLEQVSVSTTSGSVGFRIAGMKLWEEGKTSVTMFGKEYGRSFTEANVHEAFERFFRPLVKCWSRDSLAEIHTMISEIIRWIEFSGLKMYSSSLLIVYESAPRPPDEESKVFEVKLIDFAHTTFDNDEIDFNTMNGLDNAARVIRAINKGLV